MSYTDYLFHAPDLASVMASLAALRAAGIVGSDDVPANMLGDPVDVGGTTIRARLGASCGGYTDPDTGDTVAIPASIVAADWYVAIRTWVPPSEVPFDPTSFGLVPSTPEDSAIVLGVWA